jgi:alginate O-acetyltransferase complex protein AlgI
VGAVACWKLPRWRDWIVVLVSAAFVGWTDWRSLTAVVVLTVASFAVARKAPQLPKWVVGLFVVGVLSYILYYKYFPPLRDAILGIKPVVLDAKKAKQAASGIETVVPLGASYFTFKLVHYLLDSRRAQVPRHDLKTFLGYMLFMPMFSAGPIERFDDYLSHRSEKVLPQQVAEGGTRILYGLVKKMVIVDVLLAKRAPSMSGHLVDAIPFWRPPCTVEDLLKHDHINPLFVWQFVIHNFAQWYLDFSAYTDVAIGAALFFGIRLTENFDWPLLAPNPTNFWKRYHMSLSAWCQRYVYLPVMARVRNPYVAVFATMCTMGLWHAGNLNYIVWGIYHGTILSIYLTWGRIKRWRKWKPKSTLLLVAGGVLTALLMSASAVFPATTAQGVGAAVRLLGALVGVQHG